MGQKTHPIGLRLGVHRKWSTSWFLNQSEKIQGTVASTVVSHGGVVRSGREDRLTNLLQRAPRETSIQDSSRLTLTKKTVSRSLRSQFRSKSKFTFKKGKKGLAFAHRLKSSSKDYGAKSSLKLKGKRSSKKKAGKKTVGQILPVDFQVRTGASGTLFLFLFYVKLIGLFFVCILSFLFKKESRKNKCERVFQFLFF